MQAIIAGGSLGGLMTGIVLKAAGLDVDIYERFPKVLDDRGAGIVMQAETETFLTQYGGLKPDQTGVWLKYRQYLSRAGAPDSYQEMPQLMTSWGLIYRALRSAFPNERYHEGRTLNGLSQSKNGVIAHFEEANPIQGDMLVGADGSGSFVSSAADARGQTLLCRLRRLAGCCSGKLGESTPDQDLRRSFYVPANGT
jgi:2-polyprenyl-6-methoxyphenol hydroxylase-like FAD-dependent oxidoreductase